MSVPLSSTTCGSAAELERLLSSSEIAGRHAVEQSAQLRSSILRRVNEGEERLAWIRSMREFLAAEERALEESRKASEQFVTLSFRREEAGRQVTACRATPARPPRCLADDLDAVQQHMAKVSQRIEQLKESLAATETREDAVGGHIRAIEAREAAASTAEKDFESRRRRLKALEYEIDDRKKAAGRNESTIASWGESLAARESTAATRYQDLQEKLSSIVRRHAAGSNGSGRVIDAPRNRGVGSGHQAEELLDADDEEDPAVEAD